MQGGDLYNGGLDFDRRSLDVARTSKRDVWYGVGAGRVTGVLGELGVSW